MASRTFVVASHKQLSPSAQRLLRDRIGYRTESVYGSGVRRARYVISHEVLELGNDHLLDDIKITLGLLRKPSLSEAISVVEKEFGRNAIALWLSTREDVKRYC
ncbi:MAG: hypothetical protein HY619_07580, partial [Thaumarchaeota archaeon]|nr:hypothetical protein [Nitrososphaerota archaeon]